MASAVNSGKRSSRHDRAPNGRVGPDELIYRRIYEAISGQEIPPGTRLREDQLRKIFGVSRARVRGVLAKLAYEGLVAIEPNRGAMVARPSPEEARDIFAARRAIEGTIVRDVAKRFGIKEKSILGKHIAKERAAETRRDRAEMIRLSGEFHMLLVELSENRVLQKFLRELVTRESLVILAYESPGKPACSNHEHQLILDALIRKQTERAVTLMLEHLDNVEKRLDLHPSEKPPVDLERLLSASLAG
jgi:DNA-binding GntR family transcriptional regulator